MLWAFVGGPNYQSVLKPGRVLPCLKSSDGCNTPNKTHLCTLILLPLAIPVIQVFLLGRLKLLLPQGLCTSCFLGPYVFSTCLLLTICISTQMAPQLKSLHRTFNVAAQLPQAATPTQPHFIFFIACHHLKLSHVCFSSCLPHLLEWELQVIRDLGYFKPNTYQISGWTKFNSFFFCFAF